MKLIEHLLLIGYIVNHRILHSNFCFESNQNEQHKMKIINHHESIEVTIYSNDASISSDYELYIKG